jgi:hypothetical protein
MTEWRPFYYDIVRCDYYRRRNLEHYLRPFHGPTNGTPYGPVHHEVQMRAWWLE